MRHAPANRVAAATAFRSGPLITSARAVVMPSSVTFAAALHPRKMAGRTRRLVVRSFSSVTAAAVLAPCSPALLDSALAFSRDWREFNATSRHNRCRAARHRLSGDVTAAAAAAAAAALASVS